MASERVKSSTATMAGPAQERREVKDGTVFWTLSFYISRAQITGSDLALHVASDHGFDVSRFFTEHPDAAVRARYWDQGPPAYGRPFRIRDRLKAAPGADSDGAVRQQEATLRLRAAVNPLFNDIADRSRLGRIEDELFAASPLQDLFFVMPREVQWSTEGRTYSVPTCDAGGSPPRYPVHVTRFWYVHGNGSLSWHVSFEVRFRDEAFEQALEEGKVPSGLYLLSLMQKLAYPKERELSPDDEDPRSDKLFGLGLAGNQQDEAQLFWDQIEAWFDADASLIGRLHPECRDATFRALCPPVAINEVPGLFCRDTRSSFFIQDKEFFGLIQPKDAAENLVSRRTRIRDDEFEHYPALVDPKAAQSQVSLEVREPGGKIVVLGRDYWQAMLEEPLALKKAPVTAASTRLLYLFLAGFNQNIIDWTNQEASEVLDSLDPIYPKSDEQLEEGFFIRYANPRCLISYVQRSRTLEVGNDFIGTCPYAFLIHALTLHNEWLTRDQEKLAFAVVAMVNAYVMEAQNSPDAGAQAIGDLVMRAERWINWYRMATFELFDRHRYSNPFRYDTERDVFDQLERLRGTFRLQQALDKAFAALEENARDLERVRAEAERESERKVDQQREDTQKEADAKEKVRDRKLTALFGFLGLSGIGQLAFNIHAYLTDQNRFPDGSRIVRDFWTGRLGQGDNLLIGTELALALLMIAGLAWLVWPSRKKGE